MHKIYFTQITTYFCFTRLLLCSPRRNNILAWRFDVTAYTCQYMVTSKIHCDVYNVDDVDIREMITMITMQTRYRINIAMLINSIDSTKGTGREWTQGLRLNKSHTDNSSMSAHAPPDRGLLESRSLHSLSSDSLSESVPFHNKFRDPPPFCE